VRRRQRNPENYGVPESFATFTPTEWPGRSGFQQWRAWDEARLSWAAENLPGGAEDLPDWGGAVPDQPWDEVKHLI